MVPLQQASAQHRQAVKDRKKANQEKSAQVQKVRAVCCVCASCLQAADRPSWPSSTACWKLLCQVAGRLSATLALLCTLKNSMAKFSDTAGRWCHYQWCMHAGPVGGGQGSPSCRFFCNLTPNKFMALLLLKCTSLHLPPDALLTHIAYC